MGASYFNPRSSCEERRDAVTAFLEKPVFQSTLLMRGATRFAGRSIPYLKFQSTLLMRGATVPCRVRADDRQNFNPRSSCEERLYRAGSRVPRCHFNPRSSCEERPASSRRSSKASWNFNPRSSCEERLPAIPCQNPPRPAISIHAPHARSDAGRALGCHSR